MKTEIGFGTVGYGMIAKVHGIGMQANRLLFPHKPTAAPRALCTRTPAGKENMGYGQVYPTLAELLRDEGVQVCDICTPNDLHFSQGMACLAAGRAVYMEKPIAANLQDAKALCAEAEQRGAVNQAALMCRFYPVVARMKDCLEAEKIGRLVHFRGCFYHGSYLDARRPTSWRQQLVHCGGGAVMDLGVHLLDLVRHLLGEVATVSAVAKTVFEQRYTDAACTATVHNDTDEYLSAMLELENGVVGLAEASRISHSAQSNQVLEVFGTKGSLRLDFGGPGTLHYVPAGAGPQLLETGAGPREAELATLFPYGRQSMGLFMDAHAAAIQNICLWYSGMPYYSATPTFWQAVKSQQLVHACLAAAQSGRREKVEG